MQLIYNIKILLFILLKSYLNKLYLDRSISTRSVTGPFLTIDMDYSLISNHKIINCFLDGRSCVHGNSLQIGFIEFSLVHHCMPHA